MGTLCLRSAAAAVATVVVTLSTGGIAHAVPSFARQTGLQCNSCHTVFPELTPFGRDFKRHGYTMMPTAPPGPSRLEETPLPPLSAMVQASLTYLNATIPGTQNWNPTLPDQLSLFYAGRIASPLGAFTQLTYEGADDHFTMDNADIRLVGGAPQGSPGLVYGLTLDNNPTVGDLWNSTPAWGFPYASSPVAPGPAAATLVDGTLGQQVVGLGGYLSWDGWVDAHATVYRSFQIGSPLPPDSTSSDVIDTVAPYWRIAVWHQLGKHAFEIGTYGLWAKLLPGDGAPLSGPINGFLDVAGDAQYQYLGDDHILTLHTTLIWEHQSWNASLAAGDTTNAGDTLVTFRVDGTYYYKRLIGGSLGFFSTTGGSDALLYPQAPVTGSRAGGPGTQAFIVEADYAPWYNTKFLVQYLLYTHFNGAASNYDGAGRDAVDNGSLYVNAWLAF